MSIAAEVVPRTTVGRARHERVVVRLHLQTVIAARQSDVADRSTRNRHRLGQSVAPRGAHRSGGVNLRLASPISTDVIHRRRVCRIVAGEAGMSSANVSTAGSTTDCRREKTAPGAPRGTRLKAPQLLMAILFNALIERLEVLGGRGLPLRLGWTRRHSPPRRTLLCRSRTPGPNGDVGHLCALRHVQDAFCSDHGCARRLVAGADDTTRGIVAGGGAGGGSALPRPRSGDATPAAPRPARHRSVPCGPPIGGRRSSVHDLRHVHASWLLAAGAGLESVRDRMGHTQIPTIPRHVAPREQGSLAGAPKKPVDAAVAALRGGVCALPRLQGGSRGRHPLARVSPPLTSRLLCRSRIDRAGVPLWRSRRASSSIADPRTWSPSPLRLNHRCHPLGCRLIGPPIVRLLTT